MKAKSEPESAQEPFEEWAKVELFGHQVIIGKVTEATLAGGAFLRVDVPGDKAGRPPYSRFFGPAAIYAITPVAERTARALLAQFRTKPMSRFEVAQLPEPRHADE